MGLVYPEDCKRSHGACERSLSVFCADVNALDVEERFRVVERFFVVERFAVVRFFADVLFVVRFVVRFRGGITTPLVWIDCFVNHSRVVPPLHIRFH